jgi:transcriptional regulator GlxA family with amidase domain
LEEASRCGDAAVERPQKRLETTDAPIELVARRAGYDSPATMRAQFASRLQTSPRGYRQTFRAA